VWAAEYPAGLDWAGQAAALREEPSTKIWRANRRKSETAKWARMIKEAGITAEQ